MRRESPSPAARGDGGGVKCARTILGTQGTFDRNLLLAPPLLFGNYLRQSPTCLNSEKPRIRLGYTVRSPFRSVFSKDLGGKEYGYQTSWSRSGGDPTILQEPYLNSTLDFVYEWAPKLIAVTCAGLHFQHMGERFCAPSTWKPPNGPSKNLL